MLRVLSGHRKKFHALLLDLGSSTVQSDDAQRAIAHAGQCRGRGPTDADPILRAAAAARGGDCHCRGPDGRWHSHQGKPSSSLLFMSLLVVVHHQPIESFALR